MGKGAKLFAGAWRVFKAPSPNSQRKSTDNGGCTIKLDWSSRPERTLINVFIIEVNQPFEWILLLGLIEETSHAPHFTIWCTLLSDRTWASDWILGPEVGLPWLGLFILNSIELHDGHVHSLSTLQQCRTCPRAQYRNNTKKSQNYSSSCHCSMSIISQECRISKRLTFQKSGRPQFPPQI